MSGIREKVVSALRWTALARLTAQLITWLITLVVIRLLEPADYGLMAMSEVFFTLLMLLSNAGLGSALIQTKKVSDTEVRQLFGLLILLNTGLAALLYAVSPLIGAYYGQTAVTDVSRVLSAGFLFVPFITIPSALLSRDIDFKRKSVVELVAAVLSSITTLTLAYSGAGIWALVTGRLLNLVLQAIGLNLARRPPGAPIFRLGSARRLVGFGGVYTVTTILWFAYSQADVVIAGPHLGERAMGFYAVGLHLATMALSKVMPLLNQIALPAYSRYQTDVRAAGYYFLKVIRIVSIVSFPTFLGLAAVAPEVVRLVLGDRYDLAIEPIILLSLMMPLRAVSNLFPAMIFGIGRPGIELGNTLFGLLLMPIAFRIGVAWGVNGLCVAWLAGYPLVVAFQLFRTCPVVELKARQVLAAFLAPLLAAAAMSGVVVAAKSLPLGGLGRTVELVALVLIGVLAYGGLVKLFLAERAREVIRFVRAR